MKYNKEKLEKYCEEHNVTLLQEYQHINRETKIEGRCLTERCYNTFIKSFRFMVEKGGAYCKECAIERGIEKSNKIFLEKYNDIHYKIK
jgi:hypothetical protein